MAKNAKLTVARQNKNDEYYTNINSIRDELNAYLAYNPDLFKNKIILCPCDDPIESRFTQFLSSKINEYGIKKLIATTYSESLLNAFIDDEEKSSPKFNEEKHNKCGRVYIFTPNSSGLFDKEWDYLKGNGDFRSKEVTKLRNESDIIMTNPPFSLFREFMSWIMEANKQFLIIGNKNAITYKEVFPLIKENKIWLGNKQPVDFLIPPTMVETKKQNGLARWFTNIDYEARHELYDTLISAKNLRFNKALKSRLLEDAGDCSKYPKYDNFDAIEVPVVSGIPSDYGGVMGVPITFLDKYCPNQFEIIGCADADIVPVGWHGMNENFIKLYYEQGNTGSYRVGNRLACYINNDGKAIVPFKRILIRKKV